MVEMKTVYDFFVSGTPKAQPRLRMTKTGHVYTPNNAKEWKETVRIACMAYRKPVITQPVKLTVWFYFSAPKRAKGYFPYPHVSKPDGDNLLKAVQDAMTEANAWIDDAIVFSSCVEKWYLFGRSGARIKVEVVEAKEY